MSMRVNPKSIRFRLIAWYIFSLGLVHLIVATGLYQMISAKLYQEFDRRLETYTSCLVEVLPQHRLLDLANVVGEMTEVAAFGSEVHVRIVDASNNLIYESSHTPPAIAARLRNGVATSHDHPTTLRAPGAGLWRAIRREVSVGGHVAYVGLVAVPLHGVQQALAQLRFVLIVLIPCVLVLTSFGAWLLLSRALAPLNDVIRTAQAIQAKEFNQRLRVPKTGDEVQALAETFNEMVERLQHSFAQMRQFISDASHELRTPLAVLKGEVELGLKVHPQSDRCSEVLETCANEISRMSHLVETLLFLSNADAEKVALELKTIPLARVMQEMAEEARILVSPKRIQIELTNGFDVMLQADEMRLKQLLLNLIANAVKYTPEGGRITLGCRSENGQVEVYVADTGIGIEPQDLPHIFDRFYRADPSRSHLDGGYGLGLAICKWIAEAHRGTIHVESSPGQGSTFIVRLPVA